jgi:ABC-type amino acid transport substrate-binding protein
MPYRFRLVFLCLFFSHISLAADLTACIDHYPPLQILGEEPQGESITALTVLAKLLNRDIRFIEGPNFARCIRMLELGQVDVLAGLIDTPERQKYAMLLPYYDDSDYIFVNRTNAEQLNVLADLSGKIVAITPGTRYFKALEENRNINKVFVNDVKKGLEMLIKGRIDVVITSENIFQSIAAEFSDLSTKVKLNPYTYQTGRKLHFGISKKSSLSLSTEEIRLLNESYQQQTFIKAIDLFKLQHPNLYSPTSED